jgi:cell division protein FtsZ
MEFDIPKDTNSIIKVIGVGGGGSNAVNHMYKQGIQGVDFIVCNTDKQALDMSPVPFKIQLGPSLTEGRGAGSIPEVGKNAAVENIDEIREFLSKNTKMVFITAGMGGGTGTGAAPVIAAIARELNILTVGIVTVPFSFEGKKRRMQAEEGLQAIRETVDTLLVINNEKLREISGNLTIGNAFAQADDVLAIAAKGIAEVISVTGSINVDFNDVNTVMKNSGAAVMGSAQAEGEDRALVAVQAALNSPLLNDNEISGAKHVLLNITYGDKEVLMDEITEITDYIQEEAGSTADVIWGHGHDATLGDKISVTIIATGFVSQPITGYEPAPEKKIHRLDEENKKEIVQPLSTPTQGSNSNTLKTVLETLSEEPFLKSDEIEPSFQNQNPIEAQLEAKTEESELLLKSAEDQKAMNFDWDVKTTNRSNEAFPEENESKKVVYNLDEEEQDEILAPLNRKESEALPTRDISPEELQRLNQDRMARIQEFTRRLKNPNGISDFEKEPAYIRRNIQLDQSNPSQAENISRFGLNDDENGTTLRGNNSF